ncbi:UBP8 Ubiquitin carboxyl-terminal hydrolase 8 [Candida maltosa Xu316]|uniref:Ubiquitin carboxyl-terminal hydrolase n=1 Tax=Candida maltosa (strain Xu316) TaxID=1245528 RepID=M3JB27_CANMX|nr:Ubiquitin carboxyl-terminal hydrolase [Candida maltosa Xu316]
MYSDKTVPKSVNGTTKSNHDNHSPHINHSNIPESISDHNLNNLKFIRDLTPQPDNYSTIHSCSHINSVLESKAKNTVFETYKQAVLISQPLDKEYTSRKDGSLIPKNEILASKMTSLKCTDCDLNNFENSMICLQCPHVGCCFNDHNHSYLHFKTTKHMFSIDSSTGLLYCFKCGNFTNHPALEKIRMQIIDKNYKDIDALSYAGYTDPPTRATTKGLKGFVNLGATCFMSSILQTLIHNPIIKYQMFNNDLHFFNCERNHNQLIQNGFIVEDNACITCSIDNIFQVFYTSNTLDGFGMTNLLTTSWYKKKSLAGFQEQDAHEFWQFLLNEFHSDYNRILAQLGESKEPSNCSCLTHSTFSFELQSCIRCGSCNSITETVDPMFDVSLEINRLKKTTNIDLYDCLDLFTQEESLDGMYTCKKCDSNSKATKTLKLKTVPPVVSIQLKRFEHNIMNDTSSKIETPVKIPLFLDLTKYSVEFEGVRFYELFGVIVHIGSVNTGHYIAFIKDGNGQWYKFDDSVVSLVDQEEVTNSKAYLLYYITHKI